MNEELGSKGVTELDVALELARRNPAQANFFFDAFLNADVLVPVQVQGATQGNWNQIGPQDRFQPLFLDYQGDRVVPVFDRLERLQEWADPRRLDYLRLRCHTFLLLVSKEVAMVLNLGTPWTYYFPAETLEKLRATMRPVNPV